MLRIFIFNLNMVMRNYVSGKWKQFLIVIKVVGSEGLPTTIGLAAERQPADSPKTTDTAICSHLWLLFFNKYIPALQGYKV